MGWATPSMELHVDGGSCFSSSELQNLTLVMHTFPG